MLGGKGGHSREEWLDKVLSSSPGPLLPLDPGNLRLGGVPEHLNVPSTHCASGGCGGKNAQAELDVPLPDFAESG